MQTEYRPRLTEPTLRYLLLKMSEKGGPWEGETEDNGL